MPRESVRPPSPNMSSKLKKPTSSSDKKNLSSPRQIRPKSARTVQSHMTKTLYMRTSCTELRGTTKSFSILVDHSQKFIQTTISKILIPNFPILLQKLISSFDKFSNQLVSLFSTIRKTPIVRNFGPKSLMFRSGEEFTNDWINFIESVNDIADQGLTPYQPGITNNFQTIIDIMSFISLRMKKGNFISKEANLIMQKNNYDLLEMHSNLSSILIESNESTICKIDSQKYYSIVKKYVRDMNTVMDRILPNDVISPIEESKIRAEISAQCSEIFQIIESICAFHGCISDIKTQIIDFNNELSGVYSLSKLPFEITLEVEDPEEVECKCDKCKEKKIADFDFRDELCADNNNN